jgi:hypothetical protein
MQSTYVMPKLLIIVLAGTFAFETRVPRTMYYLLLLLFACIGPSASAPSASQHRPRVADRHNDDFLNHMNASPRLSYLSDIDPETWSASTLTSGNTEYRPFEPSNSIIDNVKYNMGCFDSHLTLTQDAMNIKVEEIISDVSASGRRGSFSWGDCLPSDENIWIYAHIDLWKWEPPVNAELLRDMFKVLIYNYKCASMVGQDLTKGGWIEAKRRPGNDMYARISLYAE